MKQRMTYLDIRAIVNEIRPLILSAYIQNIYSSSNRLYTLKLSNKQLVLIEAGNRIHLTDSYVTEKQTFFSTKMRKHLKRSIIKDITQVGFDRVIKIETNRGFIYLEFFAMGNIIITDFENNILEIFRPVRELQMEKNTLYVTNPVVLDFSIENMFKNGLKEMLGVDKIIYEDIKSQLEGVIDGYKLKTKDNIDLFYKNGCVMSATELTRDFVFMQQYTNFFDALIDKFSNLCNFGALEIVKEKANTYVPINLICDSRTSIKVYNTFNEALNVYHKKEEKTEVKKSEVVKHRQEKRITDLEGGITEVDYKVNLMHMYMGQIERIILAHRNIITYNLPWSDFEEYKKQEDDLKNLIYKSDFKKKICTLQLSDDKNKFYYIDVPFMNTFNQIINMMYDEKRKRREKLEKTKGKIKSVVRDVLKRESKKVVKKEKITRKQYWFEKFGFCFTSNKKLIIFGKNAQQNDILVKKYLTKDDLYFHADIHGAASVILKNGNIDNNEQCIFEAGSVALCNSNAWKNKVTSDIYYVECDQVSKTSESGEYLKTGAFMIRGKKNYLDVFKLEYGIGLLFKMSKDELELNNMELNETYDFYGNINEDDAIDFALVMAAPWSLIKNMKYKEKLLPGVGKKGKLVNEIVKNFNNQAKQSSNEKEVNAVKNITLLECTNVLFGDCKIGKQVEGK